MRCDIFQQRAISRVKIHGLAVLPQGYRLAVLPADVLVVPNARDQERDDESVNGATAGFIVVQSTPAIEGTVAVTQMLRSFGICTRDD
ncbi:hypothetical protein VTO42DRAFT_3948 [Malbranchea cinnamomea]